MSRRHLKVAGLFAGIGGLDIGFDRTGHTTVFMSEWDPAAQVVLGRHFPETEIQGDVREVRKLPAVDLVTGGFPCQDISQAGPRSGLLGARSGLVWEFFRLIEIAQPEFFVLENVANLLSLKSGSAMKTLLSTIQELGYRWAYRLVDTRGFGLPQRRQRVIILASRGAVRPEDVLFESDFEPSHDDTPIEPDEAKAYGFYWTEGRRGVGWTEDAVPTIKGGSGLGIPSPPAVYVTRHRVAGTPTLEDAERMQGFDSGWTDLQLEGRPFRPGQRWRLVGNAVSVPISEWLGRQLSNEDFRPCNEIRQICPMRLDRPLPKSGFGGTDQWYSVSAGTHVSVGQHAPILDFLTDPLKPLSVKALTGYLNRAALTTRRIPARFLRDLGDQRDYAAALLPRSDLDN